LVMVPRDFRSIQGAIDFVTHQYHRATPATIQIANGNYEELLILRGKDNLTLQGESRDGVVIHALNNAGLNAGGTRAVFLVEDADLLTVQQLTIRNDTVRADTKGSQAETLLFNSNGRLIVKDASFFSEQDTLQLKGYAWFYRTLVSGNVDFIWGANHAALFEESEIRSVGDSSKANAGGYVLQARTMNRDDKGFVFLNSTLTHGPGPRGNDIEPGKTFLARSSGKSANWDNIAFINCRMDEHVAPRGWAGGGEKFQPAPNPAQANAGSGWREFGSMDVAGKPLDLSQRVGGYLMSATEVKAQFPSRAAILGWNPR
ncbi:MAG: hypothetical protein JF619_24850, partial [Massilia sp.]|nr:hypothetical protein [Massilia sp.]